MIKRYHILWIAFASLVLYYFIKTRFFPDKNDKGYTGKGYTGKGYTGENKFS